MKYSVLADSRDQTVDILERLLFCLLKTGKPDIYRSRTNYNQNLVHDHDTPNTCTDLD
jgi:hypothetical protein